MAKAEYNNATGYPTSNRCSFISNTVTNILLAEYALHKIAIAVDIKPNVPLFVSFAIRVAFTMFDQHIMKNHE
jgi:hypothetical protein